MNSQHLDKSIFERQNEEEILRCLCTQRQAYSCAKNKMNWKRCLVLISVVFSIAAAWLNNDVILAIAGFLAVVVPIGSRILDKRIEDLKRHGAEIQQYVDASLFAPALNIPMKLFSPLLAKNDIAEIVSKKLVNNHDLDLVKNWYQNYSNCSAVEQVYYCQCENIQWDNNLRKEYETIQNWTIIIVIVLILAIALYTGMTVAKFFCVLAWGAPLVDYAWGNHDIFTEDLQRLQKIKALCQEFNNDQNSRNNQSAIKLLLRIQEKIREHREKAFLIPDIFYKLRKEKHQKQIEQYSSTVQNMTDEY